MDRFFKVTPKKGMPISIRGFAEGLAKMARALSNLSIVGGAVEWADDVPTIVPYADMEKRTYYVYREATAAEIADDETLVSGQLVLVPIELPAGAEGTRINTVPHVCPESEA